eukprot:CAMPEP_0175125640 /NCGR_PEP_ID=MMETSP0087-20121206/3420_1 /TAXON_ID=136419 /ORGANISM="Unknown Unknown, Strain D1" /LENGTH=115 /DNA_ID=CAMNT_0016407483 /DNA_START=60 /DNA_END=407 /DNA_ORIENTATION=+
MVKSGIWGDEEQIGMNGLAHPSGEGIDNSLSATHNNPDSRKICVKIVKKPCNMIFWDNGSGMDQKGLKVGIHYTHKLQRTAPQQSSRPLACPGNGDLLFVPQGTRYCKRPDESRM